MFLASRPHPQPAATILGVPYDGTASFRRGARHAPAAIRHASWSIESYSARADRDLEEVALVDRGDLDVEGLPPPDMVAAVTNAVAEVPGLAVVLGGDHTASVGAVRALLRRHPGLRLLVLDAHTDLREEYEGSVWSHATTLRRMLDVLTPDRIALLGVRSGTREEFAAGRGLLAAQRTLTVTAETWEALAPYPLYLSIDMDVADPATAPGTGNPEPGGPGAADLLDFLTVIAPLHVVGLDVMEVSPPFDPSGRTAVLAAMLVREGILSWAPEAPGPPGQM